MPKVKIHEASEKVPILTRYEPGFRRVYAKGGLVSRDDPPDEMIRLGFWSMKELVKLDGEHGEPGAETMGYALETEIVLSRDAATRIHGLLGFWLEKKHKKR